ncbi:MAG: signal recognition particle-docking protein FtsY [Oscillospiraceae bacterium]|nr:signal recognition particle-docking protein FtsY [Oscillospiraceae bacterium]
MNFFEKIKEGLRKTREKTMSGLRKLFGVFVKVDENFLDELEEILISSDVSVSSAEKIKNELRKRSKEYNIKGAQDVLDLLKQIIKDILGESSELKILPSPAVIILAGVNGAGKTTTVGKLAQKFKDEGKKVLVAAADTFRAAAVEQLEVWVRRAGCEMISRPEGSDPGSVVHDSLCVGKDEGYDIIICDTAGRLQNKGALMAELAKIGRIVEKKLPDSSCEVLLVLDSSTGQNGILQAEEFSKILKITGIILTKLDGTARGGVVISIKDKLGIPIKYIGVGEKIEDLQPFNAEEFVEALFD